MMEQIEILKCNYTHAQEQVLYDYLGNHGHWEGTRAFSTTLNADANPVDVLGANEGIFFSLGPGTIPTIDNFGEII